jgi:quercetin dioxygenase-like cupin family protein
VSHLNDMVPREVAPGFFGKFVHGERSTLAFWEIKKGSILKEHSHLHEQITHIAEGDLEMVIGGKKFLLTAGSTYVINSNTPHSAFAVTDCKVIDSFSPARDDYR